VLRAAWMVRLILLPTGRAGVRVSGRGAFQGLGAAVRHESDDSRFPGDQATGTLSCGEIVILGEIASPHGDQQEVNMSRQPGRSVVVLLLALSACTSPTAPERPGVLPAPPPPPFGGGLPAPQPPPSSPTDPIVRRYRLDLAIGSGLGCESVPENARHRGYTADIHSTGDASYIVKLYGAVFLAIGLNCFDRRLPQTGTPICHQFLASRTGDSMFLDILGPEFDDFNGNLIYEQLPDGKWIEIHGSATGPLRDGTIDARGNVRLSYWSGFPARSTYTTCHSDEFRLTFTPR
jgi:hypothetical protein